MGNLHVAFHNLRFEFDTYRLRTSAASHRHNLKLNPGETTSEANIILPSLFINNGRIIVTGCSNGKVQLWDATSGTVVHLLDHKGMQKIPPYSLAIILLVSDGSVVPEKNMIVQSLSVRSNHESTPCRRTI